MSVSYKKLFKLLIDKDLKKKDLREMAGIGNSTMTKLANNENVTMEVMCILRLNQNRIAVLYFLYSFRFPCLNFKNNDTDFWSKKAYVKLSTKYRTSQMRNKENHFKGEA